MHVDVVMMSLTDHSAGLQMLIYSQENLSQYQIYTSLCFLCSRAELCLAGSVFDSANIRA